MSQTPDTTDAKADGNFGSAGGSHRTGYANDKLANAEYWARKGGTLNAGEGAILCEEIDRLREENDRMHQQHLAGCLEDRAIIQRLRDANDRLRATLDALREPSEATMRAGNRHLLAMYRGEKKGGKYKLPLWGVISDILPAAVEAAEQEVNP